MVAMTNPAWPPLPLSEWADTYETLHMWMQIVGKTRLALAPMENHWWQIALYVTERGLTTSPMPCGDRTLTVDFDFLDHVLSMRASDGAAHRFMLAPYSVADFHARYLAALNSLGFKVTLRPVPVEVVTAIPFAEDRKHASYDAAAAQRCWRILVQADRVLKKFRGRFLGKASPVQFFWGSFDLAMTRFSGRRAPTHAGGAPNCPDYVMIEAYSHECSSWGFWPGSGALPEPAFYAYAYPEPAGYASCQTIPDGAYYSAAMQEFIFPYEIVRRASDPDAALLQFFQATYEAAAAHGSWDRDALDRLKDEWP